jgi:hypothetical protein
MFDLRFSSYSLCFIAKGFGTHVARFTRMHFARLFLLLLFMQQGLPAIAYAASATLQVASEQGVAVAGHDCGTSAELSAASVAENTMAPDGSMQHEDCSDSGCDNCVGCIAGVAGYKHTVPFIIVSQPAFAHASVVPAMPAPDLLYRPPIAN